MSKKAWEIAYEVTRNVAPVIQMEEDREWTEGRTSIGNIDVEETRIRWIASVPGSRAPNYVFIGGIQATENMGYDASEAEAIIPVIQETYGTHDGVTMPKLTTGLFEVLGRAPEVEGHPYWNYRYYNGFENHASEVEFPAYETPEFSKEVLFEKLRAGWLAQIAGVALGTITERYYVDQPRKTFGRIRDCLQVPNTYSDDVLSELVFLEALSLKGRGVTSEDIGLEWVGRIEYTWSGEEAAFKNMKRGTFPPLPTTTSNLWREWIGARMKGPACGMVTPGEPALAAKLTWTDDTVSHVNNGILGEVPNAILVSLAFVEQNARALLKETIDMMPARSEYYSVVKFTWDACGRRGEWEPTWWECEERYQRYNWVHTYPNAAAEVVSLYLDGNDSEECMHACTICGQDMNCNVGQIGIIYGIMFGYMGIAEKWTASFGNKFDSLFREYEHTTIPHLVEIIQRAIRLAMRKG